MTGSARSPVVRHGGLIALRLAGIWRGALIEGPSGCGKSDLALRALEAGFSLASDDRTVVFASQGRLFGRAPDVLAGLMEVRGLGVQARPALAFAEILLLARCVRDPRSVERHPQSATVQLIGLSVPTLELWPLEASAPAKLRRILEHLGRRRHPEYQAALAPPGQCLGA